MHPDQKDNAGYTPLHEACSRGHLEISRLLLQFGANHSETAQSGIRPLHEAVENGHTEVVRLILSYGADPLLATYSGTTPIALADTQEMTEFLQNYLNDIQRINEKRHSCWMLSNLWKVYGELSSILQHK
jgi:ankyrin repeat protein